MTETPRWPERLIELARACGPKGTPSARSRARGEFWVLLDVALRQLMRARARSFRRLSADDVHDLASRKLSDLMGQFDSGRWNPGRSSPGEVVNYLSTVARNAIVDAMRSDTRHPSVTEDVIDLVEPEAGTRGIAAPDPPDAAVERERFVTALVHCAGGLGRRDRTTWLLRALLGLSSREIATHPEVRMRPAHVDVVLMRCRRRLSACMIGSGFDPEPLPPGTFTALWVAFMRPDAAGEFDR